MFSLIDYDEPVFRPPAEAYSLIFQVTLGCSWNRCSFCEMYTSKTFRARPEQEVKDEIEAVSAAMGEGRARVRKVFLADGNALVLSTPRLLSILETVNRAFPNLMRVSAYALPADILSKSRGELQQLREAGLSLIYVGIESGDDEVLRLVNKRETVQTTVEGLQKAGDAGIKRSVMIVNGLAGKTYSRQHAEGSAEILNRIQPELASTLVLTVPFGEKHYKEKFQGEYVPMGPGDLLRELQVFIEHTRLERTIFRSDHASNFLVLKGVLSRDRDRMLKELQASLQVFSR